MSLSQIKLVLYKEILCIAILFVLSQLFFLFKLFLHFFGGFG